MTSTAGAPERSSPGVYHRLRRPWEDRTHEGSLIGQFVQSGTKALSEEHADAFAACIFALDRKGGVEEPVGVGARGRAFAAFAVAHPADFQGRRNRAPCPGTDIFIFNSRKADLLWN